MAANKRTPFEIEHHREEITRRYLRRDTQREIAAALGMTREMVAYDLKAIQERWRKDTARNLDEDKARELARIDALEREYWLAWERSQRNKVSIAEETEPPDTAQVALAECRPESAIDVPRAASKITTRTEGQTGNATYLAGVQWCISERCKLLGIYAPTKIAPTDPSGDNPYAAVSDEQLRRDIVKLVAAFTGAPTDPPGTSPGGGALPVALAGAPKPDRA